MTPSAQRYAARGIVADDYIPPGKPPSGASLAQIVSDLPWIPLVVGGVVGWYAAKSRR